jgi:hypothetical protein
MSLQTSSRLEQPWHELLALIRPLSKCFRLLTDDYLATDNLLLPDIQLVMIAHDW